MKKTALLLTVLLFASFFTNAQKKESKGANIKTLKIAFITEQLNLTSKEAQKFWPIYNKFDEKLHQLERVEKYKLITQIKDAGGTDNISENDAKTIMKKIADLDKKIYTTKVDQDIELTKVLSYRKILKLKSTERDFIRNLMKKYRRKKTVNKN
ncbi:hypothetical protein MC378_01690 [Polaribacter sp. MSW13]|uniref:Sensor of ECF-type sigma factor n=1 Tax=Polaribacter marinus TaxID=2916838 RepID=A0A9X1VNU0_9FLAO|nr:hypothetical protein [Polaribacter marinus]MCI2227860.1 hypothetical protein [Polaribacter marinus]